MSLNIKKLSKNEKKNSSIFGRKTQASSLMMESLLVRKLAYILAVLFEGECHLYLLSVLRNMSYKLEKIDISIIPFWPKKLGMRKFLNHF